MSLRTITIPGLYATGIVYCAVALVRFWSDVMCGWFA